MLSTDGCAPAGLYLQKVLWEHLCPLQIPPAGDIKTTTNPSASLGDAGEETSPLHHKKGKLNAFVAVQHANSCAPGSPV